MSLFLSEIIDIIDKQIVFENARILSLEKEITLGYNRIRELTDRKITIYQGILFFFH